MRDAGKRHPRRGPRAGLLAALALLACAFSAAPASATVSYVRSSDLAAPARSGNVLTSDSGEWLCVPQCLPPVYEWQRCTPACATVPGRTGRTYLLSGADVGTRIRSVVTVRDSFLIDSETRASALAGPIGPLVGATPAEPSTPALRLIDPFPVVVVAGRLRRGRTVIGELTVRGPRRARVSVRCRGRGCPYRRVRGTIGRRKRLRVRRAERSYRAGIVLEVRVTARNRIGKFTRLRFRSRRAPARRDLCITPGASRPSRCP